MQNALRQNHDVFAWAHSDMKGIHPSITSHRLSVQNSRGACPSFTRSLPTLKEPKGIAVSPDQVKAVIDTPPPRTKRDYNASQASLSR
ncbi:hypothetical protein CK203_001727 [Vitis vinifera]|uniref:Uncharacterized protein n=1 Tax=Vitis vinifera TaxID=29760 RepID=A0A438KJP5_VITVI|nr:hypothetical protein CK203_001727 [Vitis vinifera]